MKQTQVLVKFKDGNVTVASNATGKAVVKNLKQEELGFKIGEKSSGIPNVIWTVNSILASFKETRKATENKADRMLIAVPSTVASLLNNLDILTQLCWSNKMVYKVTNVDNKIAVIYAKQTERRTLSELETKMYRELLNNIKLNLGSVSFIDSSFVPVTHKEGEDTLHAGWCNLNTVMKEVRQANNAPQVAAGGGASYALNFYTPDDDEDVQL